MNDFDFYHVPPWTEPRDQTVPNTRQDVLTECMFPEVGHYDPVGTESKSGMVLSVS